jgi:hypothetical protein
MDKMYKKNKTVNPVNFCFIGADKKETEELFP